MYLLTAKLLTLLSLCLALPSGHREVPACFHVDVEEKQPEASPHRTTIPCAKLSGAHCNPSRTTRAHEPPRVRLCGTHWRRSLPTPLTDRWHQSPPISRRSSHDYKLILYKYAPCDVTNGTDTFPGLLVMPMVRSLLSPSLFYFQNSYYVSVVLGRWANKVKWQKLGMSNIDFYQYLISRYHPTA